MDLASVILRRTELGSAGHPGSMCLKSCAAIMAGELLRAEVIHAIREEQAMDLASVILRRTELGSAGHPGSMCLKSCAAIMAGELKWDDARVSAEIQQVEEIYRCRS